MSLTRSTRVGARTLLALAALFGFSALGWAADAPSIDRGGDWRAAVHRFAAENLKHPAWGLSHSIRDYELAKELAAQDGVGIDDDVLYAAAYLHVSRPSSLSARQASTIRTRRRESSNRCWQARAFPWPR